MTEQSLAIEQAKEKERLRDRFIQAFYRIRFPTDLRSRQPWTALRQEIFKRRYLAPKSVYLNLESDSSSDAESSCSSVAPLPPAEPRMTGQVLWELHRRFSCQRSSPSLSDDFAQLHFQPRCEHFVEVACRLNDQLTQVINLFKASLNQVLLLCFDKERAGFEDLRKQLVLQATRTRTECLREMLKSYTREAL